MKFRQCAFLVSPSAKRPKFYYLAEVILMSRNSIVLAISVALLVIGGALIGFFALPGFGRVRLMAERLTTLEAAAREREAVIARGKDLGTRLGESFKREERVSLFLPETKDPAGLITMISSLAASRGVVLTEVGFPEAETKGNVSFSQEESGKPFRSLSVSLKASGPYPAIRAFLGALGRNIRLIDVEKIKFIPQETAGGDLLLVDATLRAYWRGK